MRQHTKYHDRLKEMRKASGLTQLELSKITKIPPGTIAYYESGGGIRVDVYHLMIDACKARIADNQKLIGGDECQ